ncbi:cytochrome P450 oxidoreductase [Diaporthe helianthi]|uniref:Cytochrome P450 oxidoreductase n=1 Tax=Diaporthe helianthi TaxID=158607 RepID=A0A2P5HHG5_DIAHE|nr:cytochrome P450 oxidoreductase [Diaporthe helianthi]
MLEKLPSACWPVVAGLALVVLLAYRFWTSGPSVPGPFLARFTDVWLASRQIKGHFQIENVELHRKYGKIVRLGPKYFSLDDPAAVKTIYGHGTQYQKSEWYDVWNPRPENGRTNIFALRDIKQHATTRRHYSSVYAMSSLVSYEPYVNNCIDIFASRLRACVKSGETIDLSKWFQYYAFDVIGEITFSQRFGFLEKGMDMFGMIKTISGFLEWSHAAGFFRPLIALTRLLAARDNTEGTGKIVAFTMERIEQSKKDSLNGYDDPERQAITQPDFASKLLAQAEAAQRGGKDLDGIDETQLVMGACMGNVMAGSDTTSISLSATYYNIIKNPRVQAKLRAELDDAHARGALSEPPTFAETQALPYLQVVIKEALRMHPAVGLCLWRVVPAGGATLCGQYFPSGTNVGVNPWVAHRNKEVWGDDADEFRPERWLESSEEKLKAMNAMYMPFGLGSRTCIGKNISLLEISKVIPHFVRNFDATLIEPLSKMTELPSYNAWFVGIKDFRVNVKPRLG